MIQIISSSRYKINRKKLKVQALSFFQEAKFTPYQTVNIVFVGRKKMKDISLQYKEEDVALPVLSFIYNQEEEGRKLLGEVLICYPQAVLMAAQKGKKVDDIILQLMKHGIENIVKNI